MTCRLRRLLLLLLVCALPTALAACALNPVTGESEINFFSAADEIEMGDSMHPRVIYEYDAEYHDPELKRYLGTIVVRLHKCSHRAEMPVDFKVLNSSIFNAFALPGHVYATRGLLVRLKNEAEFAAVMGHEMSHYTARHSVKQLTNAQLTAVGLGVLAATMDDGSLTGAAVIGLGQAGAGLASLHYGRSQESQADRVGAYYMCRAGYDPRKAIDMQKILHAAGGSKDVGWYEEWLSTHPANETRVAGLHAVIAEMHLDDGTRLQGDGVFAARWNRRLAPLRRVQKAYDVFDKAEALARAGKLDEAEKLCRQAMAMNDQQAPFHRLLGDIEFAKRRLPAAREAYRAAYGRDRRYLAAVRGLAAVDLAARRYAAAEREYTATLRLLPGYLDGHFGAGVAGYHAGDYEVSVRHLEAVCREVAHPAALCYLGRDHEKLGDRDAARRAFEACVQAAGEKGAENPSVSYAAGRLKAFGPAPAASEEAKE